MQHLFDFPTRFAFDLGQKGGGLDASRGFPFGVIEEAHTEIKQTGIAARKKPFLSTIK